MGDELIQWKKMHNGVADEQFHFVNNKWEVTKNKNKNKRKRNKQTNNNNKTQEYEQSLKNSQNKL